jgi:hypothetical protein
MQFQASNDHNVYILGAGFSTTAGLPVMSGLLNRMRDALGWLPSQNRLHECEAIERVLKYRLNAASAAYWSTLDLENVEQLFSLASAAQDPIREYIPIAIAATLDYARLHGDDRQINTIFTDPSADQKYRRDDRERPLSPQTPKIFQKLHALNKEGMTAFNVAALLGMMREDSIPSGTNAFISFNYDTLVEDALTALDLKWIYGLQGEVIPEPQQKEPKPIPVLKLHGSMNWNMANTGAEKIEVFESYDILRQKKITPRLVPPTWSKDIDRHLAAPWTAAINELSKATRIVVIGFSMPETDLHFRYLLAAGLQNNAWLRSITFVNLNDERVEATARRVLRPSYIDNKMIQFINTDVNSFVSNLTNYNTLNIDIGRRASILCFPSSR